MTLGRYDSLRLCPQVELRSYVSEPELATFSGDMAQPSLGLVGPDSRYQTLPGRGKSHLSMEAFWEPLLLPYHCSLVTHLIPYTFRLQLWASAWAAAVKETLGCREGLSFLPLTHILILFFYYIFPWK